MSGSGTGTPIGVSTATYSLANLLRQAITRITREYAASNAAYPAAMLAGWISEAYRDIQWQIHLDTKSAAQNLVAGQIAYSKPTDLLGDLILTDGLLVKDAAGSITRPVRRTWEALRAVYGDFSNPNAQTGVAAYGDFSNPNAQTGVAAYGINSTSIYLLWPPAASVTNGLVVDYVYDPGELTLDDDISVLETAKPGLIGTRAVDFVLYRVAEMEHGADAAPTQAAWAKWQESIGKIADRAADQPGLKLRGPNLRQRFPAFRR